MTFFSNDSFELHGVLNATPMAAAKTFRCLRDIDHNLGVTLVGPDSGATYDEVRFVGEKKPELTTAVAAIKTLLDTLSLLGTNCMTDDGTHPGVMAYMQSHGECSANARTAGATHQKVTIAKSHVLIPTLGGQRGATAYANVRVIELGEDAETEPHAVVYNVALPATFIKDEEFVIYPPTIAGVVIPEKHILGWNLDTGIQATVIVPAGSIHPAYVDITKVRPRITIQHDDASLLDAAKIPELGKACAHADTTLWLRARSTATGGMVAKATTSHIKITAAGWVYHSRRYQASGSAVGTGELTIEGIEGVGGVPLAVTTGVAIT